MKPQFETVMARYKEASGAASYAEVGRELGLTTSAYANRKRADSIPYETLIPVAHSRKISIEWLLFGEGEPFFDTQRKVRLIPEVDTVLLQAIFLRLSIALATEGLSKDQMLDIARRAGIAGIIYNRVSLLPTNSTERLNAIQGEVHDFARVYHLFELDYSALNAPVVDVASVPGRESPKKRAKRSHSTSES